MITRSSERRKKMKPGILSASIMCVDFFHMGDVLSQLEKEKIEYLHVDVMDGEFVQNYAFGTDFCKSLRKHCSIPLDIHLMVNQPEFKLNWFAPQPGEYVSVHSESTPNLSRALLQIRDAGAKPMIALNPATPVQALDYVLDDIDGVLIMTVNPGFAGQKMVSSALRKIAHVRSYLAERGRNDIVIEVDGNVSFENAVKMRAAGADIFVGGTSSIFSKGDTLSNNIQRIRNVII